MKGKVEILKRAKTFAGEFINISRSPTVTRKMPRIGSLICRALAYQLRYHGPNSLNDKVYEDISATAFIDQMMFEIGQQQGMEPTKLLNQISMNVKQMTSEALNWGLEETLYMLENCIILFELEKELK
jgi:hypothetical protein